LIDEMLRADLDAPRKQRHTVKRIFERLLDEHGADEISYQMVRGYVADRREEIRLQAGRGVVEAFVPQTHKPGAEAEVDFEKLTAKFGTVLVVVDQPASIGALPLTVVRDVGCQVASLPGLAMRRIADLHPGGARTGARDAAVVADAAPTTPHTLLSLEPTDEITAELTVLVGFDQDPVAEATRTSNRMRGPLTQFHPRLERLLGPRLAQASAAPVGRSVGDVPPAPGDRSPWESREQSMREYRPIGHDRRSWITPHRQRRPTRYRAPVRHDATVGAGGVHR
jgi:hypothetical protein